LAEQAALPPTRRLRVMTVQFPCSSVFGSESVGPDSSITGSLITYFSLDQLLKSNSLHLSPQNGKSVCVSESVGSWQIGQRHLIV
jgi:hypothetical protein